MRSKIKDQKNNSKQIMRVISNLITRSPLRQTIILKFWCKPKAKKKIYTELIHASIAWFFKLLLRAGLTSARLKVNNWQFNRSAQGKKFSASLECVSSYAEPTRLDSRLSYSIPPNESKRYTALGFSRDKSNSMGSSKLWSTWKRASSIWAKYNPLKFSANSAKIQRKDLGVAK